MLFDPFCPPILLAKSLSREIWYLDNSEPSKGTENTVLPLTDVMKVALENITSSLHYWDRRGLDLYNIYVMYTRFDVAYYYTTSTYRIHVERSTKPYSARILVLFKNVVGLGLGVIRIRSIPRNHTAGSLFARPSHSDDTITFVSVSRRELNALGGRLFPLKNRYGLLNRGDLMSNIPLL